MRRALVSAFGNAKLADARRSRSPTCRRPLAAQAEKIGF